MVKFLCPGAQLLCNNLCPSLSCEHVWLCSACLNFPSERICVWPIGVEWEWNASNVGLQHGLAWRGMVCVHPNRDF